MSELLIDKLMQRSLLECGPEAPVGEAARLMRDARCGSILIVEDGKLLGIWTESDALSMSADRLDQPIRMSMTAPVHTVPVMSTLPDVAHRMRSLGVRHMVVVEEGNRPVGMVSQTDVIRHQGVEFFVHAREVASVVRVAPPTVDAGATLAEARQSMVERHCDALVVTGASAGFGILTARDVMRALAERRIDANVSDFASFPLLTIPLSASLFSARKLFQDHQIRHLGVTDASQVVGLLSFDDIMHGVEEAYVRELRQELRVQAEQLRRSERQIQQQASLTEAVIDALPISLMVKDASGSFVLANRVACDGLGRLREEVIGRSDRDLFASDVVMRHAEDDARARVAGQAIAREVMRSDGHTVIEHRRVVRIGEQSLLINASIDVTDWKRADALMVSSHHVLELIAGGAELPIVLNAICQRVELHLPKSMCSILLLEEDRLRAGAAPSLPEAYVRGIDGVQIGPNVGTCGTAAYRGEAAIAEDIATSPFWQTGGKHALKHGLRACWSTPFFSSDRKVLGTFAIYYAEPRSPTATDLEVIDYATRLASIAVERWRQIADLRRMATTDLLTGLLNRAAFIDRAADEIRRTARFQRPLALLMADLDRFKGINDNYGHAAGDAALRACAKVLREVMRAIDIGGRFGGEEFSLLLPETNCEGATLAAERLRQAVESILVEVGGETIPFTVSIGVAMLHPEEPLDRLIARADSALYVAKNNGRNRVECADT